MLSNKIIDKLKLNSIRSRFALLILLAVMPIVGLVIYDAAKERERARFPVGSEDHRVAVDP